jgi:alkylhydroperoxidase family enzyme
MNTGTAKMVEEIVDAFYRWRDEAPEEDEAEPEVVEAIASLVLNMEVEVDVLDNALAAYEAERKNA